MPNGTISLAAGTNVVPSQSVKNLSFIFDAHISYHEQISAVTKACYYHIRDLRRIRPCLDTTTAATIATALVQSKLDYCNSLYLNLPSCELDRLQLVQNSLARVVSNTNRFCHISPVLHSLHWLKIRERITYKVLSLTYNTLQTTKPAYLSNLIFVQPSRSTRSSSMVTLSRPSLSSQNKILDRSFSYYAPRLWNSLPPHLRLTNSDSSSSCTGPVALTRSTFHSHLKTHLFRLSYPSAPLKAQPFKSRHDPPPSRPPD